MISFWVLASVMLAIALFIVIHPLLRKQQTLTKGREQQNIDIARERVNELDQELQNNQITQRQYQQTHAEIEQALLNDLQSKDVVVGDDQSKNFRSAIVVAFSVSMITVLGYLYLGNLQGLDIAGAAPVANQSSPATEQQIGSVGQMVQRLAERLQRDPDDVDGWRLLARSYMTLNLYPEAVTALRTARRLVGDDPDVLLELADAIAGTQNESYQGQPTELVKMAMSKAPNNPRVLWMAGQLAAVQGNFAAALQHWRHLQEMVPPDSKAAPVIKKAIAAAQAQSGKTPTVAQQEPEKTASQKLKPVALTVQVSLDPSLISEVAQDDTVFIYAQALDGPPMPLAVARKQVRDLPVNVVLDDSLAMMPSMTLSKFDKVRVAARISKTGNAIPQSGDYQVKISPVAVDLLEPMKLVIRDKIP